MLSPTITIDVGVVAPASWGNGNTLFDRWSGTASAPLSLADEEISRRAVHAASAAAAALSKSVRREINTVPVCTT
jgi:hypothetical protein